MKSALAAAGAGEGGGWRRVSKGRASTNDLFFPGPRGGLTRLERNQKVAMGISRSLLLDKDLGWRYLLCSFESQLSESFQYI